MQNQPINNSFDELVSQSNIENKNPDFNFNKFKKNSNFALLALTISFVLSMGILTFTNYNLRAENRALVAKNHQLNTLVYSQQISQKISYLFSSSQFKTISDFQINFHKNNNSNSTNKISVNTNFDDLNNATYNTYSLDLYNISAEDIYKKLSLLDRNQFSYQSPSENIIFLNKLFPQKNK